jgi:DNA-binding NarL/FixJ family response regulator
VLGASLDSYANADGRVLDVPVIIVVARSILTRTATASILRRELAEFELMEMAAPNDLSLALGRNVRLIALDVGDRSVRSPCVENQLATIDKLFPCAALVLLSSADGEAAVAMRRGVRGFFSTSISVDVAIAGLRLVLAGGVYWPLPIEAEQGGTVCSSMIASAGLDGPDKVEKGDPFRRREMWKTGIDLTPRQRNVLEALELGLPNKLIALRLNLSENTVKMHIQHIMRKCFARNRTEAVLLCRGLLSHANGDEYTRKPA